MSSSESELSTMIVRDPDYFLDTIFILVENTMFQVPKYHIRTQIAIFSTTFSLPPGKEGIEGLTEDNPMVLHQISKRDFKAFLKILIPLQVPYSNYSEISTDEWISTLKLSTMWEVEALRNLAIRQLVNQLDAVNMILLGSEYRVPRWFYTGCTRLITRSQGPTEAEGNLLGMHLIVQIYGIRELSLRTRANLGPGAHFDYQRAVREAFPDRICD